jgi:hypothetical protein
VLAKNSEVLTALFEPGTSFKYSGGGFLFLEHLAELLSLKSAGKLI